MVNVTKTFLKGKKILTGADPLPARPRFGTVSLLGLARALFF